MWAELEDRLSSPGLERRLIFKKRIPDRKAFAPIGVKFWENQETALKGLKEFAAVGLPVVVRVMQAALEAANHIGDAEKPSDILREYQGWLKRETELLAEDGKTYQQQVLRTGAYLSSREEAPQTGELRTA
jgi:hypothetical protein